MSDPAEKYRDRVDPEHAIAMQAIGLARMALEQHRERYETLLKSRRDMDSFGHILDPTLYRDMIQSKSFAHQIALVEAALAFLKSTDNVVAEVKQGASA